MAIDKRLFRLFRPHMSKQAALELAETGTSSEPVRWRQTWYGTFLYDGGQSRWEIDSVAVDDVDRLAMGTPDAAVRATAGQSYWWMLLEPGVYYIEGRTNALDTTRGVNLNVYGNAASGFKLLAEDLLAAGDTRKVASFTVVIGDGELTAETEGDEGGLEMKPLVAGAADEAFNFFVTVFRLA